jgi:CRP-like cAMP-binding protein
MATSVNSRGNKLHDLIASGRQYKLSKGQVIQSSDQRQVINLINKGYIKRYLIANDGNLGIQVIYGPGDIFPLTLAFKILFDQDIYEGPEVYHYEAMTDSEIYTIDTDTLERASNKDDELYKFLLQESGVRLHSMINGLENLSLRRSYKRVAHQLTYLARRFGEKKTDGSVQICIPLTHQDMADILSATRETVSQSMAKLRSKGLIETDKYISIPDIEKLEQIAYS